MSELSDERHAELAWLIRDEYDRADPLSEGFRPAAVALADALAPTLARWLVKERAEGHQAGRRDLAAKVEAVLDRVEQIEPQGSDEWRESGLAMRTTVIREIRAAVTNPGEA